MTLKIVADKNILALDHWHDPRVELILCDGRTLSSADVKDADALLVRSITRVDASLLADSSVRFVGTATSGTDHVDVSYLQQRGIEFASAAGANAAAVADYVMCCLAELQVESEFTLANKTVAVVGVGHVGSALIQRLKSCAVNCLACDPFQQCVADVPYVSFDEALKADVICLHTPFTKDGEHPTWHLLNAETLSQLSPSAIVINAGRGEVIDNKALLAHLQNQKGSDTVQRFILDVWEDEPNPDRDLISQVYLATPHIAGYSVEAKYAATQRIVSALCNDFDLSLPEFEVPDTAPVFHAAGKHIADPAADKNIHDTDESEVMTSSLAGLLKTFSPRAVDAAFREAYLHVDNADSGASSFDAIRRSLMARRENQP